MTKQEYDRSAKHWQTIIKTKGLPMEAPEVNGKGGGNWQVKPPKPPAPRRSITVMGRQMTVPNARRAVGFLLSAYCVLSYLLLIVVDAVRQIHDVDSALLHLPVIIIGAGYLGAVHIAWQRNNVPMLLWMLAALWMVGLWT